MLLTIDSVMGSAQIWQTSSITGNSQKCQVSQNHDELVQSSTYLHFWFFFSE